MAFNNWSIRTFAVCLTLSLALVGCSSKNETNSATSSAKGAQSGGKVTIRITMTDTEITKDQIAEFNKDHPNINLERVDTDFNKLMAEVAADAETMPDIIRLNGANEFPFYAARGLALNLQHYFDSSSLFKSGDLLPVTDMFRWNGKIAGTGDIYGFVKDWSPDFDLFINKKLFADAGIPIPSDKESLTWDKVMEYAMKLVKKDKDRIVQWGISNPNTWTIGASQDLLLQQLASVGKTLYSDDYSQINLNTEDAKKDLQFWVDAVKAPVGQSAVYSDSSDPMTLFTQGKLGIIIAGYWFSGFLKANDATKDHLDDYLMLPTPIVTGGERIEATQAGVGGIIYSKTKHPEEAWTVFEWFFGGKPADDRAKGGWGLPGFKSKLSLLPTETAFDKQTASIVNEDLNHLTLLKYNPFISATAMGPIFDKYMTPVYFGKDTLDNAITNITKEVEILIKENKDIVGAE